MRTLLRTTKVLAVGASVVLWISTIAGAAKKAVPDGLAWPPGDPHVRFERLLQLTESSPGAVGRLLKWFGGNERVPLFERPYGAAWYGDDLIVTDPGARRVVRLDSDGRITASADGVFLTPIGVAVSGQGPVITDAGAGKVVLCDPDLKPVQSLAEGLERPTGVACTEELMFVVETGRHQVLVRKPNGSWRSLGHRGADGGEFNFPTSLAVAEDSLWVGDALNFRIQQLDVLSGAFVNMFGRLGDGPGDMPRVKGLAVDCLGHLWVSDAHLDQISLYASDGSLLMNLGGAGVNPGQFSFPAGIAAHPDGRIAVVDSLNRRVQIFRLLPENETRGAR